MTVIAIKNGIIAADSGCYASGVYAGGITKIHPVPEEFGGGFIAGSGPAAIVHVAIEAIQNRGADARPTKNDAELNLIWLRADGSVWVVEREATFQIKAPYHAEGSGRGLALGAMAAGASAEEAVRIACDLEQNCRGPVVWRTLG